MYFTLHCNTVPLSTADSPKPLLACSVPDLQFDLLTRDLYYSSAKLNSNRVRAISHNCMRRKEGKKEGRVEREMEGEEWRIVEGNDRGRKGQGEWGDRERKG